MTVARPWYLLLVLFVACNGSGKTPILLDQTGTLDQAAADIGPEVPAPEEVLPEVGPVDVTPEIAPADVGTEVIPETVEADVCVPDCGGRECGDDGCGGSCGDCINDCDPFCEGLEPQVDPDLCMEEEGFCARVCCPSCCDKACGDDGCGGVCGQCGELEVCHEDFCICQFESCGEGCCPDGEVCFGEKCCVPSCEGKACGGDGCGGSCGQCGEGNFCNAGACAEICESDCVPGAPTCEGTGGYLECLLVCEGCDGAGGDCYQNALTECDAGTWCQGGECVCAPKCAGKVCGDDGCGGSCGSCGANEICVAGGKCACKFAPCGDACCAQGAVCHDGACCTPVCTGMECGDDGCGGSCGDCDAGCYCGGGSCIGSCVPCEPACQGKDCGWDGCGGSCGDCTGNTQCDTGTWKCIPGKCSLPTSFPGDAFKMNSLKAGKDGSEGEAVDVDNDPATCAPKNLCSGGRDNSFGALMKSLAPALGGTEPLMDAVESGDIVMVVQLIEPKFDGTPFLTNIYRAEPVLPKTSCDFQTQTCDYLVNPESFVKKTCLPITAFDNVQLKGTTITAGGPSYAFEFPFVLALTGGQEVVLPATHAKMVAELEIVGQETIVGMSGIIGCAVPKQAIIDMVDDIPADALPISKDLIMAVLNMVVVADIDADGDGQLESVSTGMKFTAIPANLTGLAQ